MQAKGLAQPTLATSGRNSLESFGKFSRVSSWAKTFAGYLVGTEGFNSRQCVLTWKLKATQYSRFYFQLSASARPTSVTGSGLWPTPMAEDELRSNPQYAADRKAKGLPITLGMAVLLPTPVAGDTQRSSPTYAGGNLTLRGALLPTPSAGNFNDGESLESWEARQQRMKTTPYPMLHRVLGGSLNPRFVAQMMGFPPDWCELPAPAPNS